MATKTNVISSATGSTLQITSCVCERCGSLWIAKVTHPKQCPMCKAKTWDIPFNEMRSQVNKRQREQVQIEKQ